MKHLYLFEQFTNDYITFNLYTLIEHTDNDSYGIYGTWLDKNDAIGEANSHQTEYPDEYSSIELTDYSFKIPRIELYKILDIDKEYYEDYEDYELIEMFIDLDWGRYDQYYDYTTDIVAEFNRKNKKSDDLIYEVIDILNDKLYKYAKFSKYTTIYKNPDTNEFVSKYDIEDSDIEMKVRISNHTHNPKNGKNDLTVVIANDDETSNKYFTANTNLKYTSDDNASDIVDDIIDYLKHI